MKDSGMSAWSSLLLAVLCGVLKQLRIEIDEHERDSILKRFQLPPAVSIRHGRADYYLPEKHAVVHSGDIMIAHECGHATSVFARIAGEKLWFGIYRKGRKTSWLIPWLERAERFVPSAGARTKLMNKGIRWTARGTKLLGIPVLLEELQASLRGGWAVYRGIGRKKALGYALYASGCFATYLAPYGHVLACGRRKGR